MNNDSQLLDDTLIIPADFKDFSFPITFNFKIGTLANDFVATDSSGHTIAYVRQQLFKLKETIFVYSDESKTNLLYKIDADRVIDFNASYAFTDANEKVLGKVGRRGMKSIWKANYEIFDTNDHSDYSIHEENPWAKVGDAMLSEIPLLGIFTGYLFNPKYGVVDSNDRTIARLSKEATFMGKKFKLEKLENLKKGDSERILLSLMMMVLLERRRG